jgi:hypothetical protein
MLGGWKNKNHRQRRRSTKQHEQQGDEVEPQTPTKSTSTSTTPLVCVPVVQGRLLRFPGNAMHAVPKPPTKWSLTKSQQQDLDWEEENYNNNNDDDDAYGDGSEQSNNVVRSVILFNTWKDRGPRWVRKARYDKIVAMGDNDDHSDVTSDFSLEYDDNETDTDTEIAHNNADESLQKDDNKTIELDDNKYNTLPDEFYTRSVPREHFNIRCLSRDDWQRVFPLFPSSLSSPASGHKEQTETVEGVLNLHVALMGNSERRQFPRKYATLLAPVSILQKLEDRLIPHTVNIDLLDLN